MGRDLAASWDFSAVLSVALKTERRVQCAMGEHPRFVLLVRQRFWICGKVADALEGWAGD